MGSFILEAKYSTSQIPGKYLKCRAEDDQKLQGATIVAFRHAESLQLAKGVISQKS